MKLSEVQSNIAALITADAALAAFGPPISFSLFTDDDAGRTDIATRLREKGVVIEIGLPEATGENAKPANRYTLLDVNFEVFVAESPKVAHALQGLELVEAVSAAVQRRTSPAEHNAHCTSYAAAKSEQGYILHVLTFSIPATL